MAVATPSPIPNPNPASGKPPEAGKKPDAAKPDANTKAKTDAPANGEEVPPEELVHIGFFQKKWVQTVLPWATSIGLHLVIVILGYATFKAVEKVVAIVKEQVIIPDAAIVENAPVGGIPNPGLGGDPNRAAAQDKYPDASVTSEGWSAEPSEKLTETLSGGASGETDADSMIGIGANQAMGGKGHGTGHGSGDGTGGGSGEGGGPLAPFGVPGGGGGVGPKSPFMGISGNARKVAYVCDASGSMMNKIDLLKAEIRKAVDSLRPIQAFNVIFFQEGAAEATSKQGLLMANGDNKKRAYAFLEDVALAANSNPVPGLKIAFQQGPQLMYLLTDGVFPDNEAVLAEIRKSNAEKQVKINTILFVDRDNELEDNSEAKLAADLLALIAKENGGTFRMISAESLQK